MKEIHIKKPLFLLLVLIFGFFAQGSMFLLVFNNLSSQDTTSIAEDIPPLQENSPQSTSNPLTGLFPSSSNPHYTIVGGQTQFSPLSDIHVVNWFNGTPPLIDYSIVMQKICIFLFENNTSFDDIDSECNSTDPESSDHWVHTTKTNGSHVPGTAPYSNDPTHGWIDITFTVPDLTTLANDMGIVSGDGVRVYQVFYPNYNTSYSPQVGKPFNNSDHFLLTEAAELDPTSDFWNLDNTLDRDTFRQGENATCTLKAHRGLTNIQNVNISVVLHNSSNDQAISNNTYGFSYFLHNSIGNPTTLTDSNGELDLTVVTSYFVSPTPEGAYYFNVTGDFANTGYNTSNPYNNNLSFVNPDFTVDNSWDIVTINHISTIPISSSSNPLDPPHHNITIITYQVQTTDNYTGTDYYPSNIPINSSLITSVPNVTLSIADIGTGFTPYGTGWFLTNATGHIAFNITSVFPLVYFSWGIQTIKVTANLQNNSAPNYPNVNRIHRFMRNNTINPGFNVSDIRTIYIDPDFTICDIIYSYTNESTGVPLQDAKTIRAGDGLNITFRVVEQYTANGLGNVPVNISLIGGPYSGVSLEIIGHLMARPFYYNTTADGYISVILNTTFGVTANSTTINLRATADFGNDSLDVWHIGKNVLIYSNNSYSDYTESITVNPQFFIGDPYVPGDSPNATKIQQNETIEIEFALQLEFENTGLYETPDISGINFSILIDGKNPSDTSLNMSVIQGLSQLSVNSSVTFTIQTGVGGETPEADYEITIWVDFGAAQALTYNITHDSVPLSKLEGRWIKGDYNNSFSRETFTFTVKNDDIIRVRIPTGEVTDPYHSDVGLISGYYNVYRGTTEINITGNYRDSSGDPFSLTAIDILLNYTGGQTGVYRTTLQTDDKGEGRFTGIITIPTNAPITNVTIYGEDTASSIEVHDGITVSVVTEVDISDFNLTGFNGSAVFVGGGIIAQGTLRDDQGVIINSASINVSLVGWDGTQTIGTLVTDYPDVNGQYSLSYTVPVGFLDDDLEIRFNVTEGFHYRPNFDGSNSINIYRNFQINSLQIFLPASSTTIPISNNTGYLIKGVDNRSILIQGTLWDMDSNYLDGKWISTSWNGSSSSAFTNGVGYFSIVYAFTGYDNSTWEWRFSHYLDNGTLLQNTYFITLQWEVYDTVAPSITMITPQLFLNGSQFFVNPSITSIITVNVTDPNYLVGNVSGGLDNSSITITINGSSYNMPQVVGSIFSLDWSVYLSNTSGFIYFINISASDLAYNKNFTATIMVIIDTLNPSASISIDLLENDYVIVDSDGIVRISGTITDAGSGINASSGILSFISGAFYLNYTIDIPSNSYSYDWVIYLNPGDFDNLERTSPFYQSSLWIVRITFSDLAKNTYYTETTVDLDSSSPSVKINDLDFDKSDEELQINASFWDNQSGLIIESLSFELIFNNTDQVISTYRYGETGDNFVLTITDSSAELVLDTSELEQGDYFIRVIVFDNTGNRREVNSITTKISSPSFDLLGTLIQFIVLPILAFCGGIGIAALYERFKGFRGG